MFFVFFLLCAVYLAAFAHNCLKITGKYSPDSVNYINTAEVFLKTGSVSTSFCDLHDAVNWDMLPPIPMTGYNPLYPLLIAAFALAVKPAAAALVVALLGYGLLLVAAFFLLRRLAEAGTALLGTAALLHFAPLTFVAVHAWSETVALACLAVYLLLLLKAGDSGSGARTATLGAGIAGGFAFLTRVAMVPVVPIGVLTLIRRDSLKKTVGGVVLFVVGFFVIAAPVLARKHLYASTLKTSGNTVQALREIAAVVWTGLVPEPWLVRSFYAILFLVAVGLVFQARRTGKPAARQRRPWSCLILPVWALAYAGLLVYSRAHMAIDPVGVRLGIPATFALLLFLVVLFTTLTRPPFWLCASFALLLAGTAALSELRSAQWVAGAKLPPVHTFTAQHKQWETLVWLEKNIGPDDIIIAEDGMDLPLFLGPMKVLYFFSADQKTISREELGAFLGRHRREYQRAYLVLKPSEEKGGSPTAQTAAGLDVFHAEAAPLARLKDGVIFAL